MELSKEDRMLIASAEDKYRKARDSYCITHTGFLDIRQRSLVNRALQDMGAMADRDIRCEFYGGYDMAERTMAVFLPDYAHAADCPVSVIRAKIQPGGKVLTHRDYLGSLLGLGIKREMTGDILATETGADIIILDEIRDFIMMNYSKAGRTSLTLNEVSIDSLCIPEQKTITVKDTVASLRLDNVASSAFQMSRAKAVQAIKAGLVFTDGSQCEKPDMQVEEGTRIVIRGKGKAVLREVGGRSRKDRIYIEAERYL